MSLAMTMPSPRPMTDLGRIEIAFAMREGAMLRVLGLVERRGFEVRGVTMAEHRGRASLAIDVRKRDPGRRLAVVAGQLRRLHDVEAVSVSEDEV
jgi:acetolactate synthase II small subunit